MAKWSKLKKSIEEMMDPKLEFKIHANSYKVGSGQPMCRFYILLDLDIIWDYPKNFMKDSELPASPYYTNNIPQYLRDYINSKPIVGESKFGLEKILYICDKRVGKRTLEKLKDNPEFSHLKFIIEKRLAK